MDYLANLTSRGRSKKSNDVKHPWELVNGSGGKQFIYTVNSWGHGNSASILKGDLDNILSSAQAYCQQQGLTMDPNWQISVEPGDAKHPGGLATSVVISVTKNGTQVPSVT